MIPLAIAILLPLIMTPIHKIRGEKEYNYFVWYLAATTQVHWASNILP
jgi:hypothetical protein